MPFMRQFLCIAKKKIKTSKNRKKEIVHTSSLGHPYTWKINVQTLTVRDHIHVHYASPFKGGLYMMMNLFSRKRLFDSFGT